MSWDLYTLTLAGRLVTRRWRRDYQGKRRTERTEDRSTYSPLDPEVRLLLAPTHYGDGETVNLAARRTRVNARGAR